MKFVRTAVTVASAGLLAVGTAGAANAAPAGASFDGAARATCYVGAQKPYIVGGVGNTAAGVGTLRCAGGTVRIRIVVTLQKKVGARWANQRPATTCTGFVGGATKTCTERNGASPGLWRTQAKATILSNGSTKTVFSGPVRFVPARTGGVTA